MNDIKKLAKQADKFNEIFNSEINSLKNTIARSKEREERVKKRIDEEMESSTKRQEEVEELVTEIRKAFDRNVKRLRDHQKEQLKTVFQNNKSEVEKWQQKYNSLHEDYDQLKDAVQNDRSVDRTEAEKWQQKYESLQEEYNKLRNQRKKEDAKESHVHVTQESKDVEHYQDELKMANIEIHSLKRKLDTKSEVVEALHKAIRKNEKLINQLEGKLTDESENVKKWTQKVELYRSELEEKKDELEEKCIELKRIKSELEDNQRSNGDHRKNLEATRENELKWKAKSSRMEERVESLLKEVEETKRLNASLTINAERKQSDLEKMKVEHSRVQKNFDKLKLIVADLNNEVDGYHARFAEVATSKNELVKEKGNWNWEVDSIKKDLEKAQKEIQKLNENQDEMASLLSSKENEIEEEKSEILYLKGRLEEEQLRYMSLEEMLEEYQRSDNDIELLKEHIIALKEETSVHITNINLLEREKYILNGKYQNAKDKEKDLRRRLHDAENRYQECEKKYKTQKKVYEEQEAQQMKLIDFLKEQNTQNEKKKKPFLTINSRIVGEEGSKALKAEQDKNRRMNEELDELKKDYDKTLKEVRQLKSQLVELHNTRDQAMFSQMPCKFNHNFDIVQIEHSLFRKCFKCGKKLHKSARKCRSCGIMSHVDCKIETGTCGVATEVFQPSGCETTPINSDGSVTSGSPQMPYYPRASAPNQSETEEDENDLLSYDKKLKKIEEQFYIDNNISPSKRKNTKPSKSAKRNRTSPDRFSFSDSIFKDILE